MKLRTTTLLVLSALLVFVVSACASDNGGEGLTIEANTLTVAGSGGYRPFNYIDDSGDVIGFDVDVGEEVAARLDLELNYVTGEWSGLIEGLRNNRYDAILGSMAITEERSETVDFTTPYYFSGAQLVVREDSGISSPDEMEGRTIAISTGSSFADDVVELGAEARYYDDDNSTMMELINGRVDAVITDRVVALESMRGIDGGDALMLAGDLLRLEEMAIAINQDNPELRDQISEVLEEMHADGTLAEISEKWQDGEDITVQ